MQWTKSVEDTMLTMNILCSAVSFIVYITDTDWQFVCIIRIHQQYVMTLRVTLCSCASIQADGGALELYPNEPANLQSNAMSDLAVPTASPSKLLLPTCVHRFVGSMGR